MRIFLPFSAVIEQIAKASNSQSDAITQVTQSIEQISAVVQTNSATAEESATASEELNTQAQVLKSLVSKFHLIEQIYHNHTVPEYTDMSTTSVFNDFSDYKY